VAVSVRSRVLGLSLAKWGLHDAAGSRSCGVCDCVRSDSDFARLKRILLLGLADTAMDPTQWAVCLWGMLLACGHCVDTVDCTGPRGFSLSLSLSQTLWITRNSITHTALYHTHRAHASRDLRGLGTWHPQASTRKQSRRAVGRSSQEAPGSRR
jgi:hypothetical protein